MRKPSREYTDSALFTDIVWGVEHDAFEGALGKSLLRAWSVGAYDQQIARMIRDQVRPLRTQEAFGQLVPFRKPRLRDGDLTLGFDTTGDRVRAFSQFLVSGLFLLANTGGGKSVLISFLTLQVAASKCPIWISDMYKTQMRQLRPLFGRLGIPLIVLRPLDWKFNLLQAGPCNPKAHLAMVVDILIRVLGLPPRARSILRQGCHYMYCKFSIWEGRTDAWPNLFDLYEWVRSTPGLNAAAREAILDRLGSLLTAMTPQCAAYRLAWNPSDLGRHSIVFEMRGTSESVKQMLLESTLFSLFQHEYEQGGVNRPLNLFVVFDDAYRYLSAGHEVGKEITPIDELAGLIRGSGKGLCRCHAPCF